MGRIEEYLLNSAECLDIKDLLIAALKATIIATSIVLIYAITEVM